jgi:septal ring factor EnvC (AmiA/AmiB activator)
MTTWFTTAQGDDIDDTLERVAHWALTEFCERHLSVLGDTAIALIPVQNGNAVWCKHVSSLLQEVTATGAHLRLRLEECAGQVKAKNRVVKDIQKGNRELLQKNTRLETRIWELNDELMRTYRSRDFKTDDLDDTRT